MIGARFDTVLACLGSTVHGLYSFGLVTYPAAHKQWRGGGRFTYVEDAGACASGPVGFYERDLVKVLGNAKVCILVSRDVTQTEARAIEVLMLAHLDPCTVLIRTTPEHHSTWARRVRRLSGRGPVMHVLGNVDLPHLLDVMRGGGRLFAMPAEKATQVSRAKGTA
jgi:hypothetical protein